MIKNGKDKENPLSNGDSTKRRHHTLMNTTIIFTLDFLSGYIMLQGKKGKRTVYETFALLLASDTRMYNNCLFISS
ncbi:MAG: hypothetical protein OHK0038_02580 [Flammeovirgaceae bacterium]